jgi:hypothetical protein
MSQAHYPFMGYPIPSEPVKAQLTIQDVKTVQYDYVIAPFGRSAPEEQKWPLSKWFELINSMPDYTFAILGNSKYDEIKDEYADNAILRFDLNAHELANTLLKAKYGCISIVTGISHFCYHLGVKNFLLANQGMTWGLNPESVRIDDPIPTLSVHRLYEILKTHRDAV